MMGRALYPAAEVDGRFDSSVPPSLMKVNAPDTAPDTRDISPVWNAVTFRRSFPDRWAQYLRENYRTAYAVQKAFGIDGKTARDWIGGKRDPSGSFVMAAVTRHPHALQVLGGQA